MWRPPWWPTVLCQHIVKKFYCISTYLYLSIYHRYVFICLIFIHSYFYKSRPLSSWPKNLEKKKLQKNYFSAYLIFLYSKNKSLTPKKFFVRANFSYSLLPHGSTGIAFQTDFTVSHHESSVHEEQPVAERSRGAARRRGLTPEPSSKPRSRICNLSGRLWEAKPKYAEQTDSTELQQRPKFKSAEPSCLHKSPSKYAAIHQSSYSLGIDNNLSVPTLKKS